MVSKHLSILGLCPWGSFLGGGSREREASRGEGKLKAHSRHRGACEELPIALV